MKKTFLFVLMNISLAFSGELLPFPFIYVEGKADTSVVPNMATISFWVKDKNIESFPAKENVEKISGTIIDSLKAIGIKPESITAYEITKEMERDFDSKEMKILGYECSRRFEVLLSDLSIYENISQFLLSMNNIDWLKINFSRNDKNMIDSVLTSMACKNAKVTAEQLAGSLNSKICRLYAISKSEFYEMSAKFGLAYDSYNHQTGASSPQSRTKMFVPQLIEMHGKINAIFEMKK